MGCGGSTEPDVDTGMQFASFPQCPNRHTVRENLTPDIISLSDESRNENTERDEESLIQRDKQNNIDELSDEESTRNNMASVMSNKPEVHIQATTSIIMADQEPEDAVDKSGTSKHHEAVPIHKTPEEHDQASSIVETSMPIKVYSANREIRKLMAVSSYQDLVTKCKERLNHDEGTAVRIVLYEDGMEVDEESFKFLQANSNIMILAEGEEWIKEGTKDERKTETTLPDEVKHELGLLKQMISKRPKVEQTILVTETTTCSRHSPEPGMVEEMSCVSAAPTRRPTKKATRPALVTFSPGWKDYSQENKIYYQVKSNKFHKVPSGDITLSCSASHDEVLSQLQNVFFPNGRNFRGQLSGYDSCLGNAKSKVITQGEFSFRKFVTDPSTQKMKIFLLTKKKTPTKVTKRSTQTTTRKRKQGNTTLDSDNFDQQHSDNDTPLQSQTTSSTLRSSSAVSLPSRHEQITQTTPVPVSRQNSSRRSATSRATTTPVTHQNRQSASNGASSRQLDRQPTPIPTCNQPGTSRPEAGQRSAKSSRSVIHAEHYAAQQQSSARTCPICADAESDAVIIPCMHALCYVCGIYLMAYGQPCHMCRGNIFQVRPIHYN